MRDHVASARAAPLFRASAAPVGENPIKYVCFIEFEIFNLALFPF
jgi:hypothetical protein